MSTGSEPECPTRLLALDGRSRILLRASTLLVGRHLGCDVRLESPRVSRRHCCLALVGGVLMVRDLSSRNGTRINGQRVDSGRLRPGDVLAIADLRYVLDIEPPLTRFGGVDNGPPGDHNRS